MKNGIFKLSVAYLGMFAMTTYYTNLYWLLQRTLMYFLVLKSVNLQYNTVERRVDGMIVPPSDGPMFILIDW